MQSIINSTASSCNHLHGGGLNYIAVCSIINEHLQKENQSILRHWKAQNKHFHIIYNENDMNNAPSSQ